MPMLFCGTIGQASRRVYSSGPTLIQSGVFNSFLSLTGLAMYPRLHAVANFWHIRPKKHTAISWRERGVLGDQTIFIPSFLDQREALELARDAFGPVIPSPIIFRFSQDYHEALVYD